MARLVHSLVLAQPVPGRGRGVGRSLTSSCGSSGPRGLRSSPDKLPLHTKAVGAVTSPPPPGRGGRQDSAGPGWTLAGPLPKVGGSSQVSLPRCPPLPSVRRQKRNGVSRAEHLLVPCEAGTATGFAGEGRTRLSESCGLALHPHPGKPASEPGAPLLDNRAAPPVLPWRTGGQLSPFQARRRPPFTPPHVHQTQPPTLPWPHLLLCSSRLPWRLRAFAPAASSRVSAGMSPPHRGLPWPPGLRAPAQPHGTLGPSPDAPRFLRAPTSPSSVSPSNGKPRRLRSQPRCRPAAKRADEQKAQREIRRLQGGHRPKGGEFSRGQSP